MLKMCDNCPVPPRSLQENLLRAECNRIRVAKIGDDVAVMKGGLNLEYIQPTYGGPKKFPDGTPNPLYRYNLGLTLDNPDDSTLARRCREYITSHGLNGMMLDTPFENKAMPIVALSRCNSIRLACEGFATMINVGDAATYMGLGKPFGLVGGKAVELFEWILVEVAVDLLKPFDPVRWRDIVRYTEGLLDTGKSIVLGVNDEGGAHIDLALAIMHSVEHINLYWHYETQNYPEDGTHFFDYCWHPMLDIASGRIL